MTFGEMFQRPERAWWLVIAPVAGIFLVVLLRRRAARLRAAVGVRAGELIVGAGRPPVRAAWIFASAAACAVFAAMEPAYGSGDATVERRGADVVVCLDVSRSMLATDVAPSRLDAAKAALGALARHARGDRFALVVFAGEARLLTPMTADADAFVTILEEAEPASVGKGGTDLGAALDAAAKAVGGATSAGGSILLATDGEDHEGRGRAAAERCAANGVVVHTIIVGRAGGAKIAVGAADDPTFVTDSDGQDVLSVPDAAGLRALAAHAGGGSVDLVAGSSGLAALYDERVAGESRRAYATELRRVRTPRFQWPLALAVLLFLVDFVGGGRRRA